jgi:diguanylate cyclase (GGDEF)-like protein
VSITPREPRAARAGTSVQGSERRTLAVMLSVATLCALVGAVAPMTPDAPVALNGVLAAVGAGLVGLVLRSRRPLVLHLGSAAVVAGLTAVVGAAATPAGAAGTGVSYLWVPLYAGFFFSRGTARCYVAAVAAAFALALAANPFPGAVHVWFLVVVTSAAAAEVVSRLVHALREHAATDPLTGLLNREGLRRAADRLRRTTAGRRQPLTLAVIDLDGFKVVNDTDGHEAGDRLLVRLAHGWDGALRADDVAARLGGDEFVLLLPGTDLDGARALVARLRALTPLTPWSVGLVDFPADASLTQVLRDGDRELYAAKRARSAPAGIPVQRRGSDVLPVVRTAAP